MAAREQELIERYEAGPEQVAAAVAGCSAEELRREDAEGWSVHDVLVHLADAEAVRATRVRLILAEERPVLFDFDEGRWRERLAYRGRSALLALESYRQAVRTTADLVVAMPDEAWERDGVHAIDGEVSVRALIERGIRHAEEHTGQVARLLARAARAAARE